ncbi:thiolase family protein [Psychrobacter sp. FDAARGOS_221]|uniref:thiolase family protein n=1 Tax=Psychrobacter sp. FDAARGOS_221 TaxID=1975705 RepID=UPI000BB55EF0|nr:acetyl-CoA C-acyltransferase [Psychrobacter sp. FDAARGOS_221]PNK61143.1 acetyl-CoA C-acyltransferase [Psychrobacter sp. FDAARGOS_221]
MSSDSIVIVSGARTPMGGFQGDLAGVTSPTLGATAIKAAVERAGVKPEEIDEVIMGCILTAGIGQGPARQAMRNAGIPDSTGAVTINKLCGSGLKAVMQAHDAIKAGSADIIVAGGMESMTNAPYILPQARQGFRMGHKEVKDHMFLDGLEDADTGKLMGQFAQEMADEKGYTREQMDDFAIESLNRALTAIKEGHFKDEITPVTVKTRKGEVVVDTDGQPPKANAERIPTLRPAFAKDGTITAANASSISDGAAAVVVTSEQTAKDKGFNIEARIISTATHSRHPSEFTIAPIGSIEKVLDKAGWSVDDVDLWEINEAFAMVTMAAMDELNIPHEKVNIEGGACALGHPVGCSGARILVTLINSLKRTGGKKGVASLCIGGGEAVAVAIELA